jgi:hypothetical protein
MGVRELITTQLTSDATLNADGINLSSTFLNHDKDTPQVRPLMVLRWQDTSPGLGTVNQRNLQVWVHDTPGDYTRIDRILKRVRIVLESIVGINAGDAASWVTQIDWKGDSDDLDDDEAVTFCRNSNFTVTGSAV